MFVDLTNQQFSVIISRVLYTSMTLEDSVDTAKRIINDHISYRRQIIQLAKSNMIKTYRGAAFGWAWAIIKPAITIFVFWFAFSVGLRHGKPVAGFPFFLWLIAGFTPWFYMRDVITEGAGSIRKYKYLVQRIKYPVDTIPTFVSLSNLVVNIFLFALMVLIFIGFGYYPNIYWLQIPFYYFIMFIFFTFWSLFSGMLSAISKDFLNLVKAMVTALFWMSGIIYNADNIENHTIRAVLMFNPVTIIANGFRNSVIYHRWFWDYPEQLRNYFIVTVVMMLLAIWAYRKLEKEIPDVL